MKNKTIQIVTIAVAALLASVLFYDQSIGINSTIFSLITLVFFIWNKKLDINNWLAPLLVFINGISLCISFQWLSFLLYLISFLVIIGAKSNLITNYFYSFCQGFTDLFSAAIVFLNSKTESETRSKFNTNTLIALLASLPIVIIFFILYSSGNPVFSLYLSKIDLSFIDFGSILFFAFASYFCVAIFTDASYGVAPNFTDKNPLIPRSETETPETETTIFSTLFIALSALLGLFHLADFSLVLIGHLPEELTMADYLHQGFWTLVVSIILSVILVLAFFRDQLGYHIKSKKFQAIASIWLSLNTILLLSTAIKNTIYVLQFGLTYKRIAVYAFLGIALLSIIACFIKIFRQHNLAHFSGKTFIGSLLFLSVLCVFPWDAIITDFNLSGTPKDIDSQYLLELNNNCSELNAHKQSEHFNYEQQQYIQQRIDLRAESVQHIHWQEWNFQIQKEKSLPVPETSPETINSTY